MKEGRRLKRLQIKSKLFAKEQVGVEHAASPPLHGIKIKFPCSHTNGYPNMHLHFGVLSLKLIDGGAIHSLALKIEATSSAFRS